MSSPASRARHLLALSRGVSPGSGSRCAICGDSPFDAARPSAEVLSKDFSDYQWVVAIDAPDVCAGCVSVLSGRPGDDPPPLRVMHALAVEGAPCRYPGTAELSAILRAPPDRPFVLVVAESRKRHASLRAGVSSADRIEVGLDDGCAVVTRDHLTALDAIERLRRVFTIDDIIAGQYQPALLAKYGAADWTRDEGAVAPLRPSRVLRLLVTVARKPEAPFTPSEALMDIPEQERIAANLIARIAEGSELRTKDGLGFWKSVLPHRLHRFSALPLRDCVSRLMTALGTGPFGGGADIPPMLAALPAEHVRAVEDALRSRAPLVLALAAQEVKRRAAERVESRANPTLFSLERS